MPMTRNNSYQIHHVAAAASLSAIVTFIVTSRLLVRRLAGRPRCNPLHANDRSLTRLKPDPYNHWPRQEYLSWDDYFMAVAFLSAERSKDPNKQVGACIVNKANVILGIGYNGFPRGCHDSRLPWAKKSANNDPLETKYPYVVHAEANALLNKNAASVEGARIYVTMFPCNECAKLLIQAGIREVVFHEDKIAIPSCGKDASSSKVDPCYVAAHRLLDLAGVKLRQHTLSRSVQIS